MWVFSEVIVSICYFEMIFCISWPFLWPVYKGQLHWTLIFLTCSYSVVGFLDKNKDNLYQDFKRLLYNGYGCPIDDFSIHLPAWQFIDIMRRNKLGTDRVVSFMSLYAARIRFSRKCGQKEKTTSRRYSNFLVMHIYIWFYYYDKNNWKTVSCDFSSLRVTLISKKNPPDRRLP